MMTEYRFLGEPEFAVTSYLDMVYHSSLCNNLKVERMEVLSSGDYAYSYSRAIPEVRLEQEVTGSISPALITAAPPPNSQQNGSKIITTGTMIPPVHRIKAIPETPLVSKPSNHSSSKPSLWMGKRDGTWQRLK